MLKRKLVRIFCSLALLSVGLPSASSAANASAPLSGVMSVEFSAGAAQPPGVIVSVTVTNNGSVPLCINSGSFPYISLFFPTRLRLVDGSEIGWGGLEVGHPKPDELGQALHMVVVVRPNETLNGSTNIARRVRFLRPGPFEVNLDVQYSDCRDVAARNTLASSLILPLKARFNIPQDWPGVR